MRGSIYLFNLNVIQIEHVMIFNHTLAMTQPCLEQFLSVLNNKDKTVMLLKKRFTPTEAEKPRVKNNNDTKQTFMSLILKVKNRTVNFQSINESFIAVVIKNAD